MFSNKKACHFKWLWSWVWYMKFFSPYWISIFIFQQLKLWGFVICHLFGVTLGTGDYGHLTIDHVAMLLRLHRTFAKYSNQGFEASHKVHGALYSRATNHDQGGIGDSCELWFLKVICQCPHNKNISNVVILLFLSCIITFRKENRKKIQSNTQYL